MEISREQLAKFAIFHVSSTMKHLGIKTDEADQRKMLKCMIEDLDDMNFKGADDIEEMWDELTLSHFKNTNGR
jgi:hypothetical protein